MMHAIIATIKNKISMKKIGNFICFTFLLRLNFSTPTKLNTRFKVKAFTDSRPEPCSLNHLLFTVPDVIFFICLGRDEISL